MEDEYSLAMPNEAKDRTRAFFGHLVTLDDDAPDGFSNSEGSSQLWHRSQHELLLKVGLFGLVCYLVFSGQ